MCFCSNTYCPRCKLQIYYIITCCHFNIGRHSNGTGMHTLSSRIKMYNQVSHMKVWLLLWNFSMLLFVQASIFSCCLSYQLAVHQIMSSGLTGNEMQSEYILNHIQIGHLKHLPEHDISQHRLRHKQNTGMR